MVDLIWRRAVGADAAKRIRALLDDATDADGRTPVSEHVVLQLRQDTETADTSGHLVAADGGRIVGYAYVDADNAGRPVAELVVDPEHRRQGVGAVLVSALIERAGKGLHVWAHGEHPAAVRLAERFGFRRARELVRMRLILDTTELPEPRLSEGVRLRTFIPGQDEAELVRVNNRAFSWHPEQGGWDVEQVTLREAEPWFDPTGFFLAVNDDDQLLGYHWTKIHPAKPDTGNEPAGEVYVLGIDPDAQGLGLGSALTLAGLRHLEGKGLRQVMLYVEADNARAIRVYEKLGFTRWDADVQFAY